MHFQNKKFLMGMAFAIGALSLLIAFDRLFLGGTFSTNNSKMMLLEKDLEYTTQEALSLEQKLILLKKEIRVLKPLAERTLEKEKKLIRTEQAYTQAQYAIFDLSEKIENLKNQFQVKLAEMQMAHPDVIHYSNGRYSFNAALFFENASASLNEEGEKMLEEFAVFLKSFIRNAPLDFDWFIRVDGHTNHLPIENDQFPSNWYLASARALAVVAFLEQQGVPGKYMVASSFSSYWPMVNPEDEQAIESNRRIEFSISHY